MKRPSSIVFLLLLLAMASPAWAEAQEDKAAVIQTMTDYFAAWAEPGGPSFDLQRALAYYHEPLMLILAGRVSAFMTRAESEAWGKSFVAGLKERGAVRTELRQLHVKQVSAGVAIASVQAVRYKADGQELGRIGATYVLGNTSNGWKIAVLVGHDPGSVLRLD